MGRAHRWCDRCDELKRADKMATKANSAQQYCKHCYTFIFKAQNIGV